MSDPLSDAAADTAADAAAGGRPLRLLLTCEHGGHEVPGLLRSYFVARHTLLTSHRGWDAGALDLTHQLAEALAPRLVAPPITATLSRLVVDLNRSPWHRHVFSEITRPLPAAERRALLARHHHPYRHQVRQTLERALAQGERVLHLGVHSFTPIWNGQPRPTAIGLLYDPRRPTERDLARRWTRDLERTLHHTDLRIHRNRPYRGTSDGLTTTLRREFPEPDYLGFELEMNQQLWHPDTGWGDLVPLLVQSLGAMLGKPGTT